MSDMLTLGGYQPDLLEVDVKWPFCTVFDEDVAEARWFLNGLFSQVDRRWNEPSTVTKVIVPVLEKVLGFPGKEISMTPDPKVYYQEQRRLDADLIVGGHCVVEAKRIGVALLNRVLEGGKFSNAIDQGLTYLDNYGTSCCLITNGWDWYMFSRVQTWDQFDFPGGISYFGLRFRLDDALSGYDNTHLAAFMNLLNYRSISGNVNQYAQVMGCSHRTVKRNMYDAQSNIYFRDFSVSPPHGRGSGFNWRPVITANPVASALS